MHAVEFCAADLALGGRPVLGQLNLAIATGAFVGVFGGNGAGKTTLMRAVLGLVPPARGAIRVLGAPAVRGNHAIGYMPQGHTAATARLDGRTFVGAATGGARWGLPWPGRAEARELDRALDLAGATGLARRPLHELSGGERQRLLLAQALLGNPRLLLLDEPLVNLDVRRQQDLVALVRTLRDELGLTVLFSSHEINPLLGVLDQVLYLGQGEAALGTVDEVVTGPVLSRLYGTAIEVMRLQGRIFVVPAAPVA